MAGWCLTVRLSAILFSAIFWNVENFFDYFDGGLSDSDREFSYSGERHWNKKRFTAKAEAVGKTILWAGCPDVVGLAEIENRFVLHRICSSAVLYKKEYRFVHFESHDRRGIDVALLYRAGKMKVLQTRSIPIIGEYGDTLRTRDILYVKMSDENAVVRHFFINHHPSKYSGGGESGRMAAMKTLMEAVDSVMMAVRQSEGHGAAANIIVMGDFNDSPSSAAFSLVGNKLENKGLALEKINQGSIRYHGQWSLIDNFLVSPDLAHKTKMEILRPPFLLERDRQWPGDKPKRCYIGPRYNGGVSDHLPIRLTE